MAISYNKLWKLLVDKKMSKADLRKAAGSSAPEPGWSDRQGRSGHQGHRRRCHRPGRRYPSRRFPRSAGPEPRVPRCSEGCWFPDPRPQNEGEKEVRSEGRTSCSSVQQALNCTFYIAKALKTPELSQFRGFSF